jgi:hypothetical protein
MDIETISDEELVGEMNDLRLRLARTTHLFLNSDDERKISDGQIASVFLDLAFEIFVVSEIEKNYVMELAGKQFDCTNMRVSMDQREHSEIQ